MARKTLSRLIFQVLVSVVVVGALLGGPIILMLMVDGSY